MQCVAWLFPRTRGPASPGEFGCSRRPGPPLPARCLSLWLLSGVRLCLQAHCVRDQAAAQRPAGPQLSQAWIGQHSPTRGRCYPTWRTQSQPGSQLAWGLPAGEGGGRGWPRGLAGRNTGGGPIPGTLVPSSRPPQAPSALFIQPRDLLWARRGPRIVPARPP